MAAQTSTRLHQLLGLVMWGDIGPLTMYRSQYNRLVIFQKTWPDTPPTPRQVAARQSMTCCGRSWQALGPQGKAQWNAIADELSLRARGYNLWVSWRFKQDIEQLKTLERQSGYYAPTAAHTATVFDPRYRAQETRPSKNWPDPYIYRMPHAPWMGPNQTCILWYMPWHSGYPYMSPVATYFGHAGAGTIYCPAAYNKIMVPIYFTSPPGDSYATIRVTCVWPDDRYHVNPFTICVNHALA